MAPDKIGKAYNMEPHTTSIRPRTGFWITIVAGIQLFCELWYDLRLMAIGNVNLNLCKCMAEI